MDWSWDTLRRSICVETIFVSSSQYTGANVVLRIHLFFSNSSFVITFSQVRDIREAEHKAASHALHEVYEKRKQYAFPTFTEEEKRKISELGLINPDDKDDL